MDFNLPTVIILILVVAVFSAIVIKGILNRKKGKSSCGCNCSGCAMKGACHDEKK